MLISCLVLSCSFLSVTPVMAEKVIAQPVIAKSAVTDVKQQHSADPTQIKNINKNNLISLVLEAEKRYFYTNIGGSGNGTQKMEVFTLEGREYRYLSSDIGTHEKLLGYLMKTFTRKASEKYIKERFIEHKGRMAQLNADKGNLLEYGKATVKLIKKSSTTREYKLTIPYPENQAKPEIETIKVKKVNGVWRIATPPEPFF